MFVKMLIVLGRGSRGSLSPRRGVAPGLLPISTVDLSSISPLTRNDAPTSPPICESLPFRQGRFWTSTEVHRSPPTYSVPGESRPRRVRGKTREEAIARRTVKLEELEELS